MKPLTKDPFFGLKYIAYGRSELSVTDDLSEEAFVNFAKWQICKVRNLLWNDPKWHDYTNEEILIEFFSIKFDENENLRKEFALSLVEVKDEEYDWLERMTKKYANQKQDTINVEGEEPPIIPEDFEVKF